MGKSSLLAIVLVWTGVVLLAGCGAGKPAYCAQVQQLEGSVATLKEVELTPSGVKALVAELPKLAESAKALASAVKSEFAPQIRRLEGSLAALERSAQQLRSEAGLAAKAKAAESMVGELKAFESAAGEIRQASSSKCR